MSLDSVNYDKRYVYKVSETSGEYIFTHIGNDEKNAVEELAKKRSM